MPNLHRQIHARLMNPDNAVPDPGIDLRRPKPSVVPFRPHDITRPEVSELHRLEALTAEFWHPYHVDLLEAPPPVPKAVPGVLSIILATARTFDVSVEEIVGDARHKRLVTFRHVAVAIACRLSGRSLTHIGMHFHRDHSSILHARNKMRPLTDAVARELYDGASHRKWAEAMKRRLETRGTEVP